MKKSDLNQFDLSESTQACNLTVRARAKNPFQDYAGRVVETTLAYLERYSVRSWDSR